MKVTALIPDDLIAEVRKMSGGKNITDSLIIALREWLAFKTIQALNDKVKRKPLNFRKNLQSRSLRGGKRA